MLKILTVPEETETLRQKSRPIEKINTELVEFLTELEETLKSQKDPAGVGLSAVQVGKAIRVFAMFLPPEKHTEPKGPTPPRRDLTLSNAKPELTFYINPEIVGHAAEMTLGEELVQNSKFKVQSSNHQVPDARHQQPFLEGCLSIPRIYGAVLRYPWINAKATVFSGNDLSPMTFSLQPSAFSLSGLSARVFQHELDHLNGILFPDHVLAQGNKLFRQEGRELVEMAM